MRDKSGFELGGADVQLAPVALPQRLGGDVENAAGFRLRDALGGEHLNEATLHVSRVMRGSTRGAIQVFHT